MKAVDTIQNGFWRWLNLVSETLVSFAARFHTQRSIQFVEGEHGYFTVRSANVGVNPDFRELELHVENGNFAAPLSPQIETVLRGSRLELLVRPDRFVFRPLELPSRAAEFLDGVVRAQIDRLTPWSANQAAFGFSMPADVDSGRIVVTVAATAKAMLAPLLKAFSGLGAGSVVIRASAPEATPDLPAITIMEENVGRLVDVHFVRRILLAVLAATLLVSVAASIFAAIIGSSLETRQDELARQIARQRSAALTAHNAPGDPRTLAEDVLARRKNESPSSVIALEILSQILPDNTYVTDMHVEGNKLRLTGITHDAPQLIRLIELTRHFSQATFFAPITSSTSDPGDRFSIEARTEPNFSLTP
jgi:general secretion pathway protein L